MRNVKAGLLRSSLFRLALFSATLMLLTFIFRKLGNSENELGREIIFLRKNRFRKFRKTLTEHILIVRKGMYLDSLKKI